MNAHQLNKYIGAVLAALVFAMGLSVLSEIIFEPHELYDTAYVVAIADEDAALQGQEAAETPLAVLGTPQCDTIIPVILLYPHGDPSKWGNSLGRCTCRRWPDFQTGPAQH